MLSKIERPLVCVHVGIKRRYFRHDYFVLNSVDHDRDTRVEVKQQDLLKQSTKAKERIPPLQIRIYLK